MVTTPTSLTQLDPQWAWSQYQPSAEMPWSQQRAAHLLRRAGIGVTAKALADATASSPESVVQRLLQDANTPDEHTASAESLAQTILATGDAKKLSAAWVYRLLHTRGQLQEKMTLFWHGHFATSAAKVENPSMMWEQNNLLRRHALGDFAALVQSIAKDPAMLIYLDSASNRKSHPNENFARELMELFCLGEGTYSERDVQELARCFTGWEIRQKQFRKNRYQQDRGVKQLLGTSGPFDGEDAINLVLQQPAMPRFVCSKLVRFFVFDEPSPTSELIAPLADLFVASNLQIQPVVQRILTSNLFYSKLAIGRKIRSPVELVVGFLRSLSATCNTLTLAEGLEQVGQGLFFPPNVKGWDGGRSWINSSTLLGRANLIARILRDKNSSFAGGSLAEFFDAKGLGDAEAVTDWIEQQLLAVPLSESVRSQVTDQYNNAAGSRNDRLRAQLRGLAITPQFQLG